MTGNQPIQNGRAEPFLGNLHRSVGVAALILFIGTGAWMHFRYDHLRGMTDATRLLFRSTHIYLLLAALLNVAMGLGYRAAPRGWPAVLQRIGSALLLLTPLLFLAGFLSEPWLGDLQRPWSRPGIYACLAGVLLHLIAQGLGRESPGAD